MFQQTSPCEECFFDSVDQKQMVYTDANSAHLAPADRLEFDLLAKAGRWPDTFDQLPAIKEEMFSCVIRELDSLYPQEGLEYLFSVFDLLTFRTADKAEQKGKLTALCERFGKPRVHFSKLLQKMVCTEALFDPGQCREFFHEWFYAHPLLVTLSKRARNERQVELYAEFLVTHGSMYNRVAELIRIMLIHASNSSLIERAFSFLKAVKTPKRNALGVSQLERLILLGMNLPDDLSQVDIDTLIERM